MGTEVLRPQDCLIERIRVPPAAFPRRRSYGNYSSYYNHYAASYRPSRKPATRPDRPEQRKRVLVGASQPAAAEALVLKKSSADDSRMAKGSGLVMEKFTILRRGQSLDSMFKNEAPKKVGDDWAICGTERLGPNPEMVPKQIGIVDVKSDVYAGSAFAVSPSPSALPLPSFRKKKQAAAVVDDSATRDLRRLLRLD